MRHAEALQRHGGDLSMLLFDLDHFKRINDQFGHVAGDAVLRVMAQRVGSVVRQEDTFGRFGGEEFALLLPETPLSDAIQVAEKIRHAIGNSPVDVQGVFVPVTASVGAAAARSGVPGYEVLIHEADAALYSAKRKGRNCSVALT